jgi:hypothetical protein
MKSFREIYNEASEGCYEPDVMMVPCEACGGVVTFIRNDDTSISAYCDGCERPMVTLMTHNPRKLGVITGLT